MTTKDEYHTALLMATEMLKDISEGWGAGSDQEWAEQAQAKAEQALRDIHPLVPEISEYEMAFEDGECDLVNDRAGGGA